MESILIHLNEFRLPDHPNATLNLDASPLSIVDIKNFTSQSDTTNLTPAIGIATTLYNWCPDALSAFLDLDAWFSLTWNLSLNDASPNETRLEIGRVGNQITFGSLNNNGENWTLMLTYNITMEGSERGVWVPNVKESMQGQEDITSTEEIDRLGREWVREALLARRWETGKKIRHRFFVEYAPMDDVWSDGIRMNPHWLYKSLDLTECTTCRKRNVELQRCGRCGTATYCSGDCQRRDWAVHKDICALSMEDRGQALAITEKGGLIMWDVEKTFAEVGSGEESRNANFVEPQKRRVRRTGGEEELRVSG
ncbi:Nn.00g113480.m01.CDS01 [Neocucurbitaria sp. VM-36]